MVWLRGLGRLAGWAGLLVLLAPVLAIVPAAIVDRGADGPARVSAFPMALAMFDPFVWDCARNSLAVAAAVAAGSLTIGVTLGRVAGPWRFWGRWPLWALAMMVPMASGPLLVAPAIAGVIGGDRAWDWLASRSVLGVPAEVVARWLALAWVGLTVGVPPVALATSAALGRVDPGWSDAARAVGASRRRAWRDLIWPIVRPPAARAAASVFAIALVEPAGPMVFGLRRTLAVQILEAAARLDQPTRAATLALIAVAIASAGRALIVRWGGTSYAEEETLHAPPTSSPSFRRASAFRLALASWCVVAVVPVALLGWRAFEAGRAASPESWPGLAGGWLLDPTWRAWLANSATTALLAVGLDLAILAAIARRRPGWGVGVVAGSIEAVPPMALGVGALAIPWLLRVAADSVGGGVGDGLDAVALELGPGRSPGFLLVLGLAAVQFPMLRRAAGRARGPGRSARMDASRLMGEPDRRARRAGEGAWPGPVPAGPALLALAMAASHLPLALLLAPTSERRTLAPTVLGILIGGGPVDPRAFGPIAAIVAVHLGALAMASRGRAGPIGDWSRAS